MLLSIKELEVRKLPFAETYQPGEIDFPGADVVQKGPLKAEGVAEMLPNTAGEVRVSGRIQTEFESECDRCLGRATFPIDATFDLYYRSAGQQPTEEETAIDEGEAEMGFFEMPGLVLEDILREQVLFQFPMQRLCSPDCKGICPICGGNRNETDCECESHPGDDRWGALKEIRVPQK